MENHDADKKPDASAPKYAGKLHVYGPVAWHDDVFIVGTDAALIALRDGITAAIEAGHGACLSFAADGEGFATLVVKTDETRLEELCLPYSDRVAAGRGGKHPAEGLSREEYARLTRLP